jgi:class 3 adenylate cyclase
MAEPVSPEGQGKHSPDSKRVADADRDRTVNSLREHLVEGRLTLDEFSERMGAALQAKTRGELDAVMADLPARVDPLDGTPTSLTPEVARPRKASRWHVAVMSGHSTKGRWRIGGRTKAVAVMGGCDMDLRGAEIEGHEVEITAVAFWGGIQIIVPEGFDVELRGFSFMGGRSLRLKDVPIVPGSPRIVVRGFAVMGGVEVKSRPSRLARRLPSSSRERASRSRSQQIGTSASTVVADALDAAAAAAREGPVDLKALGRQIRRELDAQLPRRPRVGPRAGPHPPSTPDPTTWAPAPPPPPPRSAPSPSPTSRPASGPSSASTPAAGSPSEHSSTEPGDGDTPLPNDGTVTILFCDMVNYAGMTERLGDQASRRVLLEHHRTVRDALARQGGREINVQGDGFMVAFGGVARAMRCAIDIQRAFGDNLIEGEPVAVHIGIHTGDAVVEDDDYLGHTVIVASRLADAAAPGEILVSSLSEQLVQGSGEFSFAGHRETRLKGMARAQQAATLSWADRSPTADG